MTPVRPLLRLALAGGLLAVAVACQTAPAAEPDPAGAESGVGVEGDLVYVANQDDATISIIDPGTLEVVGTVDLQALGYGPNARPHHVAVEADGSHWYVSLIGADRVLKLDRRNTLVGEAVMEVPGMLALDRTADRLYVGRSMSAVNPPQRIGIIDRGDMTLEEISVFFPRPHALVAHPTLPLVYSASLAQNAMAVVLPLEEAVEVRPIAAPAGEHGIHALVQWAVSPDGRTLVGTGEMSGRLLVYDLSDPLEPERVAEVEVGSRPWHPVFSPDGREVWLANKGSNTVTVVAAGSWTVAAVVEGEGLAEPHGAAVSSDGRYVFISNNNLAGAYPGGTGTVVAIDRARRQIVAVIPVGANAAGVATSAAR